MVYEVVWTRQLSTLMGSSTYSLSTILAAVMMGLALGSVAGGMLVPRLARYYRAFGLSQLGIGLTALPTGALIKAAMPIYLGTYFYFHESFLAFTVVQFAVVFLLVLIPTVLMGMTFPLVIKIVSLEPSDIGKTAGLLNAANTVGAVLGALGAGFILVPLAGATSALYLAAGLNVIGGLAVLMASREQAKWWLFLPVIAVWLTVAYALDRPFVPVATNYFAARFQDAAMLRHVSELVAGADPSEIILYQHEGIEGDVYLMRDAATGDKILLNNGKLEGGERSPGFVMLAQLPMLAHGEMPRALRVLNIGLGSGVTLAELAEFPDVEIDAVELNEGIIEANRRFLRRELFGDPRIRHICADGRQHLLVQPAARYDVVVVSPSWAVEPAAARLLTDEFLALGADRLAPDGVLALWLDLFYATKSDINTILRTVRKNFAHAMVWNSPGDEIIVLASNRPFPITPDEIRRRMALRAPAVGDGATLALADDGFHALPDGALNTDDEPVIEFRYARAIVTGLQPQTWQ